MRIEKTLDLTLRQTLCVYFVPNLHDSISFLLRRHLLSTDTDSGYFAMANGAEREVDAVLWAISLAK